MDEVSVVELAGRLVVSLGVVLAIMFVAALLLKRSKGAGSPLRRRAVGLEVISRQSLGRTSSVAVVRAGSKGLVLGVTDSSVRVLAEVELDEVDPPEAPGTVSTGGGSTASSAWKAIVETMRERTVRRS